jgi:hypothetical protein
VKDLKLSGRFAFRGDFEDGKRYSKGYVFKEYQTNTTALTWRSSLNQWTPKEEYSNLQATADYDKQVGPHAFHALVGYSHDLLLVVTDLLLIATNQLFGPSQSLKTFQVKFFIIRAAILHR